MECQIVKTSKGTLTKVKSNPNNGKFKMVEVVDGGDTLGYVVVDKIDSVGDGKMIGGASVGESQGVKWKISGEIEDTIVGETIGGMG